MNLAIVNYTRKLINLDLEKKNNFIEKVKNMNIKRVKVIWLL